MTIASKRGPSLMTNSTILLIKQSCVLSVGIVTLTVERYIKAFISSYSSSDFGG